MNPVELRYKHFPLPGAYEAHDLAPVAQVPPDRERFYCPWPHPMVKVKLRGPNGADVYEDGVLDTGADTSTIPLRLLDPLGIDRSELRDERPAQIGDRVTRGLLYPPGIDVEIAGSFTVRLEGWFPLDPWPWILLGRSDFFPACRVTFDQRAGTFTLEPHG